MQKPPYIKKSVQLSTCNSKEVFDSIICRSTLYLPQLVASKPTRSSWLHSCQCLLDIEFADDIAIYMQQDVENLKKLESGLSLFCKRSNGMINWHKSCAIWLYDEAHHAWHPHPNFMWINSGANTKCLGFQIGFNFPPETMIAPIIQSIRQKLIHWSPNKLSLASHIVGGGLSQIL